MRKRLGNVSNMVKYCSLKPAAGGQYEVQFNDDTCVVDLVNMKCSCRLWMLTSIPCLHALACIYHARDEPARYVDAFYHKANCIEVWKHALTPIDGNWPTISEPHVLPP